MEIRFKWRGKKYKAVENSPAWYACIVGGALTIIGCMAVWYFVLFMMCPNPM